MGKYTTIKSKGKANDIVTIQCYNQIEKMKRKDAILKYYEAMVCCEGSEAERYTNIYCQLIAGETVCNDLC